MSSRRSNGREGSGGFPVEEFKCRCFAVFVLGAICECGRRLLNYRAGTMNEIEVYEEKP